MTTRDLGKLWLLLSAGVTYDEFMVQTEIAAKAGSAGFIAGRAVWDAVAAEEAPVREKGIGVRGRSTGPAHRRGARPWATLGARR